MPEIHPAFEGFEQNARFNGRQLHGVLIPETSRKIIMGKIPPPSVKDHYWQENPFFYYGSAKNHFWNRIERFVTFQNNIQWKWLNPTFESELRNVIRKIELAQNR